MPVVTLGGHASDFELKDQHGQLVQLSDFREQKNVVLIFYPYAFTRVCRGELCEVRDRLPSLQNDDVQVLGISTDTMFSLRIFAEQEGLDFPLLSDFWPHGAVASSYGVFNDQFGCAKRGSFIVDKTGILRWSVINDLPDARNISDYLKVLQEL